MPNKLKLIVCPRCHRTVPSNTFRMHLSEHKSKKRVQFDSYKVAKQKATLPQHSFTPEMSQAFAQFSLGKPTKSNLSQAQFQTRFESSLRDVGARYASLKVELTNRPLSIEVKFDEKRELTLSYNPASMNTYSEGAIDGILLHEACHVATLPNTDHWLPKINDPVMIRFFADSVENYDEYLAHVELVKKFRNDPRYEGLREHQTQLFSNFKIMANATTFVQSQLQSVGRDDATIQAQALQQISAIVYDSIFFYVANDNAFKNWSIENSLQQLAVFVGWFYEDFEYIRSLNLPHRDTREKVMVAANLSLSVNPVSLLANRIEFAETTKDLHKQYVKQDKDVDIALMWEKRRLAFQPNS